MKRARAERRGAGRPAFADGEAKAIMFSLRMTPEERVAINAAADRARKPVTQWAREILVAAAAIAPHDGSED